MAAFDAVKATVKLATGRSAFKSPSTYAHLLIELLAEQSKIVRFAKVASRYLKVIAVFGIVIDAFILIYTVCDIQPQSMCLTGILGG